MYLIKLLQHKGMPQRQLSVVVSRILYVLPAWGGFLGAELIGRINAFFRRVKRFGYIDTVLTVDELLCQSEYDLSVKTSIPGHSLHHLLPRIVEVSYVNVDIHSTCLIMTLSCLKSPLSCALYTNLSHFVFCFYMCYFVYSLYVMMCVCRILIKITYLLTYRRQIELCRFR